MNILELIKSWESENIEFKENFSEKVIETLVAFANYKWWKILLWINNSLSRHMKRNYCKSIKWNKK